MVTDFNQLYYKDSYLQTFDAKVLETKFAKGQLQIRLDRTAFYPEGGGQAGDTGYLFVAGSTDKIDVVDTIEADGLIWHLTAETQELELVNRTVQGRIDWERRYDLMVQHSAEHIYSGLVNQHFGYDNVGFHINDRFMTIDFNGVLTDTDVADMERLCNIAIRKNLNYEIDYYASAAEAPADYRSKIELPQAIRIVTVPGYDRCACCGTQVKQTGEIGLLKVIDRINYKGGVRLTLLAGQRALDDYVAKHDSLRELSALLSSPILETVQAVERLQAELENEKADTLRLTRRVVDALNRNRPTSIDQPTLLVARNVSAAIHKELGKQVSTATTAIALLCSEVEDGSIHFTICGTEASETQALLNELKQLFSAKGGGKSAFISGQIRNDNTSIEAIEEHMTAKGYKCYPL